MAGLTSLRHRFFLAAKSVYQQKFPIHCPKTVGFVMGVQRSGTGMLNRAFENDWNCVAFGERGGLSLTPETYLWKPYAEVAEIIERQRAPLVIAKPLVEMGRIEELLNTIPGRLIWMFRHYEDVCRSGQQQFGLDAIKRNLKAVLNSEDYWYSLNMDDEQRATVSRYYSEDRGEHDLRALGWYTRNLWYFRLGHLPMAKIRYEHLVSDPKTQMRRIYDFLGKPYPGDHIVRHIHQKSVKRGTGIQISDDIRRLCDSLLLRI